MPKWLIILVLPMLVSLITSYGIYSAKQAQTDQKLQQIEVDNAKKMNKALAELQNQLNSSRKAKNRVRIFWTIDKGDTSAEQKKQWLIERSNCVYYVFSPENHTIPSNYIKNILENVKKFEESMKFFKKNNVNFMSKYKKQTITDESNREH